MSLLSQLLSDTFIYSFGWTLLHSLWHGAIISFLTLLILFFLRKHSSSIRYQISIFSMISVVVLSVWTFISLHGYFSDLFNGNNTLNQALSKTTNSSYGIFWFDLFPEPLKENIQYFTMHLPIVITLWFVSVIFLSVKYLGAYVYSQRLKHTRISAVRGFWIDKLREYSSQLNLRKPIELFESAIVKVPMVIGYFKPVILVPLGLFTGIPQKQIEAILIHELAHIKRKDYLVKLLQTIVEIIFFFNPFVWWISSIINKEREHCCDDLAISITKDNISFVRALAGLCELEFDKSNMALAFGKSNTQIIKRMERVMKRNENKNSFSHFTIALVILLASLVALGSTSLKSSENEAKNESIQDSTKIKVEREVKLLDEKKKKEMFKLQESITKLEKAYKAEKDPDVKRKYKQKLVKLKNQDKKLQMENTKPKKVNKDGMNMAERDELIKKLTLKLKKTKDEKTQNQIKKKIQYLRQQSDASPPPPPPANKI